MQGDHQHLIQGQAIYLQPQVKFHMNLLLCFPLDVILKLITKCARVSLIGSFVIKARNVNTELFVSNKCALYLLFLKAVNIVILTVIGVSIMRHFIEKIV